MGRGGSAQYASSAYAYGLCDRCGFRFRLSALHKEIYDQRPNGLKVCRACLDVDHPQLQLGRISVTDAQSLFEPRPDIDFLTSTSYFGWMPIGNPITYIQCSVGTITVLINGVVA